MERIAISERPNWRTQAEALGFSEHTPDGQPYWHETHYYQFTLQEIEEGLEAPSQELNALCLSLVEEATRDEELLIRLGIPSSAWDHIGRSWADNEPTLYGRMDFSFDGHSPARLLEFNADTPTTLFESAIFQWLWLEEQIQSGLLPEETDQFNLLHQRLVETLTKCVKGNKLHLASSNESEEDKLTTLYLADCASQARKKVHTLFLEQIEIDNARLFTAQKATAIHALYKLYPWELIFCEDYATDILTSNCQFIEPSWKSILSNKAILPLLWERHTNHPNLLPAFFEDDKAASALKGGIVRKPFFSREGEGINIFSSESQYNKNISDTNPGSLNFILQDYHPLPAFDDNFPMCGVWLVGDQPAGLGIREDRSVVTGMDARFVPHTIKAD